MKNILYIIFLLLSFTSYSQSSGFTVEADLSGDEKVFGFTSKGNKLLLTQAIADLSIGKTYIALPGANLQKILDDSIRANKNDRLLIAPGVHIVDAGENRCNAGILLEKSGVEVVLMAGSELKIKDNSNKVLDSIEINTTYADQLGLDDISAFATNGTVDSSGLSLWVKITSINPDIVSWQYQYQGRPSTYSNSTPIVADQNIDAGNNITFKFDSSSGHTLNDTWRLLTTTVMQYPIRIGCGFQEEYIDGVTISGSGKINSNFTNQQNVPSQAAAETQSSILVAGRVVNTLIEDVTLLDGERGVFFTGFWKNSNGGVANNDGTVTGGETFDLYNIKIDNCNINSRSGILTGHPYNFYRGRQYGAEITNNTIVANDFQCIELNHFLNGALVEGNYLESKTKKAISAYRSPENVIIRNNTLVAPVGFTDNAPPNWYRQQSVNVVFEDIKRGKELPSFPVDPVTTQDRLMYFNSVSLKVRVYTGFQWEDLN